jgi:AbrB family looped-hinge helix DNA binding protein
MPVEFTMMAVRIGNSIRVTIPKEICEALDIREGQLLRLSLTDSEIRIRKDARARRRLLAR